MTRENNFIQKYNSKIDKEPLPSNIKTCDCSRKADCPMNGNCLSECLIYKASVNTTTNKYFYGTCENTTKERCNNHKCFFKNKALERNIELFKYIGIERERY